MENKENICVGIIRTAHGIKGEVKLKSYDDISDYIFEIDSLFDEEGNQFKIKKTGKQKDVFIISIEGVTSRNDAELLRGKELYTLKSLLPELDDDEFYIDDLVGVDVVLKNGDKFGKVISVQNFGASDLIEIEDLEGKAEFYAFTKEVFPEFNKEYLIFCPPETF